MKSLLLLAVITAPLLLTGCETAVVSTYPAGYHRRAAYVERDDYYYRTHRRPYRRDVVVVNPQPYRPVTTVRYYNDNRGRYYYRSGRRVYVNARVY